MVSGFAIAIAVQAAPSPLSDESFLLFLAETAVEEEGVLDPLNMAADKFVSQEQVEQDQEGENEG